MRALFRILSGLLSQRRLSPADELVTILVIVLVVGIVAFVILAGVPMRGRLLPRF